MIPNKDCLYPGCTVTMANDTYFVYKTNDKSLYVGKVKYDDFLFMLDNKQKGTLADILKNISAKKVEYKDVSITAEQFNFYTETIQQSVFASDKKVLNKHEETIAIDRFKKAIEKRNWKYPFEGKRFIFPVDYSENKNLILLHIEENYFFFNVKNRLTFAFEKEKHYKKPRVLWDELIFQEGKT